MSEQVRSDLRLRRVSASTPIEAGEGFVTLAEKGLLFFASLLLLLAAVPDAFAGDGLPIVRGEVLSLSRAIEIALKTQPSLLAATYTLKANEARVGEAKSNYYPQLSGSASYSRLSLTSASSLTGLPLGAGASALGAGAGSTSLSAATPTGTGPFNQYVASAGLNQLLYDFGKTAAQVQVSRLNKDAAGLDLTNLRQTVTFNVKQAYYNVLQAQRNADVAKQSVKQFREHLEQARGFFDAGTTSRFDVTKAEVDLSNAEVNLMSAENQIRLAFVSLNNAIGIPDAPDYELEDALRYEPYALPFDDAITQAYAGRPDLAAQIKRRESSKEAILLAQKGYFPAFTANGNYNYSGFGFPLESGWSYGMSLSVPIFEGLLTRYQVREAEANLGTADANERSLRLDIYSQVQQGYVNLRDAAERIKASDLTIRQAKENVELANGRYEAGVGSPLEVTDAIVAQSNAELTYTAALRDYKNAQAAIEKAIGTAR